LETYERELAARQDDWQAARNVALVHRYLGSVYEKIDPAQSFSHLRAAVDLDARRSVTKPRDRQTQLDYSFDISMLGTYFEKRKNYTAAAEHFEKVAAIRLDLWQSEPKDTLARERLAFAFLSWGRVLALSGQPIQGRQRLGEALEHSEALLAITGRETSRQTAERAREVLKSIRE